MLRSRSASRHAHSGLRLGNRPPPEPLGITHLTCHAGCSCVGCYCVCAICATAYVVAAHGVPTYPAYIHGAGRKRGTCKSGSGGQPGMVVGWRGGASNTTTVYTVGIPTPNHHKDMLHNI